MKGLIGRTAIVTGAGQGIGLGIALRLAAEGMKVVLNDIHRDRADAALEAIRDLGGDVVAVVGDVSMRSDATALVDECLGRFGRLDCLVNNAGIDVAGSVRDTSDDEWRRVHTVDLYGPFLTTQCAVDALSIRGGTVINIASNHAIATIPDRSAYASAKAGVVGLTRALAVELGPVGVRVNAVLPGYIQTPIWSLWLDRSPDPAALLEKIAGRHPLRRLGAPDDVGGVVAFLASDDSAFITGTTILVDGGYSSLLEPGDS